MPFGLEALTDEEMAQYREMLVIRGLREGDVKLEVGESRIALTINGRRRVYPRRAMVH